MTEPFYWRHGRDNILTEWPIRMFQILVTHEGEDFKTAKDTIDSEYLVATGQQTTERHGGKVQTQIQVFREAGWVFLEETTDGKQLIRITDAGKQAHLLLTKLPDFLKAVPHFVMELFSRFQLNNPAGPGTSRDQEYDTLLESSDVFPMWTLYKIMYECDKQVTSDELKRFVFTLKNKAEIPNAIKSIMQYRQDKDSGMSDVDLNNKYGPMPSGANYETKYIMGRFGTHIGKYPSVLDKEGQSTWKINDSYLPFIEELLKHEPLFKEYPSESAWMATYGKPVDLDRESLDELGDEAKTVVVDLPDDDSIWLQVSELIKHGAVGIVLSGPPGTSKSWYAAKIAAKLTLGDTSRHRFVQFHPSYSYDDFIEGYIPVSGVEREQPAFRLVDKIFLKMCRAAANDPDHRQYVLVIDEFTRSDPSRVFGELLTYLERPYRNREFTLTYSGKRASIPDNLLILGTMNPYDKSVTDLDDAMERRFERIAMEPSVPLLQSLLQQSSMEGDLAGKVIQFFVAANKKAPHGFGHTYFLAVNNEVDLIRLWNHKLKFVLSKMFKFEEATYKEIKTEFEKLISNPSQLS